MFLPAGGYFLPANGAGAGYGDITDYWSSTAADASKANNLNFNFGFPQGGVNIAGSLAYNFGCAVRLVIDGYVLTLADGTQDAAKWTASTDGTNFGALPIGGLKGDGSETVTLKYNGRLKVKSVKATSDAAPATVPVTAITLNKTETSIKVGATETLSVTAVAPDNATDKTYTWKTSDETKATVDQDGKVTAVAAGTVTIYAEANDGSGVKGNCAVTVTPATITVTWNNDDITGSGMGTTFTKDGVTITAGTIDFKDKNFMEDGTFSTTLGNFTKIEVTTGFWNASGTGWSGSGKSGTWTGTPASSVPFSGMIMGMSSLPGNNTKFVFTIEPTN